MIRTMHRGAALGAVSLATPMLLAHDAVRYRVTNLGSIPASSVCPCFFGEGLDEAGGASGMYFNTSGFRRTFYWDGAGMIDIGTLGGEDAVPRGMAPDGAIVGYSDGAGEIQHAFHYKDGVMTGLGTLGGMYSVAHDANASGMVVGNANRTPPDDYHHAFRWHNGAMLDLGTFGGEFSSAEGINEHGDVVGWAWNAGRDR